MSPPFLEPSWIRADDLEIYTDASVTWGFGAYFRGSWFSIPWTHHQRNRTIQWKKLFAIVVAAGTWGSNLAGRRVHFHCDNLAFVQA